MEKRFIYIIHLFLCLYICHSQAQEKSRLRYYYQVINGDTILNAYIPETVVFPPLKFKNDKERLVYNKLVRDVKKTLPYAKQAANNIIETYEFMEMLPDKKSKEKHLQQVQKFIMEEYKPKMKKLTKNQGKILVKLIDRQTNSSVYDIVKSLVGSFKATFYNTFAGLFGNSLKTQYDPEGKDKMIERVVTEIEQGTL